MNIRNFKTKLTLASGALVAAWPTVASADGEDPTQGLDFLNKIGISGSESAADTYDGISNTLVDVLKFVRGGGIIICVILLCWCAIQLAASAGNQQKRAMAMEGIKNVLIAVAIIGGATLISSLAYGILQ